ncbi:MAG: SPFH domain-containing protein [Clostridia bacterium]|nr:SPFH domain-containing protein [Clostridia bacterium]
MGLFKKNKKVGVFADIIRCDEPSYLIWKWRPDGAELGEHKREYAIRWGSSLRVKDGEVAVFVYKQKDGTMQDYIVGPYDEKIKTANLPILSGILGAFVGGDTPFQAEIYFINLANIIQVKFAVPYFDVCDPRYPDFAVPIAVRGTIGFKIADYREFIRLHRLDSFNLDDFQNQIRDAVSRYVKGVVANAPTFYNISVLQIESKTTMINNDIEHSLGNRLKESFGVIASGIDIGTIEIDKSSSEYRQLVAITKDVTTATIQGQTAANIENYAEALRIQREEGQYALHKQTQTSNLSAYQVEKQTEVGVAGAEALGQMGANSTGGIDLGGGAGFNPATMMVGMALGGAVGQNIAGTVGGVMANINQPINQGAVPPPIPKAVYYVAVNGQATGPYDINILSQMVNNNTINKDTFVWKNGMTEWEKAGNVEELKNLFTVIPSIPTP